MKTGERSTPSVGKGPEITTPSAIEGSWPLKNATPRVLFNFVSTIYFIGGEWKLRKSWEQVQPFVSNPPPLSTAHGDAIKTTYAETWVECCTPLTRHR